MIRGESGHPSKHRFFTEGEEKNLQRNDLFLPRTGFVIMLSGRGKARGRCSLGRPAMRLETAMDSVNNLFKRD